MDDHPVARGALVFEKARITAICRCIQILPTVLGRGLRSLHTARMASLMDGLRRAPRSSQLVLPHMSLHPFVEYPWRYSPVVGMWALRTEPSQGASSRVAERVHRT